MTAPSRAILLTPAASGAIAVIRLAGPLTAPFLQGHFSKPAVAMRPVHGLIEDAGRSIDDAVVVLSERGDVADLNVHGGPWVVRSVLDLADRAGFEVVEPAGDVPLDAVDAPTLLEREVLASLPLARTEPGLRLLLAQPAAWEELRTADSGHICERADAILRDRSLHWLLHPPRVAIAGAPNVGKSTLANQLFAQERSITADLPGTTRDWVGELANIDGLPVLLIDTPGQREGGDAIERDAIERSAEQIRQADLVLLVLDATIDLEAQRALVEAYPQAIRIANKADRPARWDAGALGAISTVATTGQGVDAARAAIRGRFGCEAFDPARPCWWTDRQRAILERAAADPEALGEIWSMG